MAMGRASPLDSLEEDFPDGFDDRCERGDDDLGASCFSLLDVCLADAPRDVAFRPDVFCSDAFCSDALCP
ncbi:MAG: hypothetical protein AAFV01_16885, partial [Bacteroidota bacterium]